MKNKSILKSTFIAFFAAVICLGAVMRIPLGPIPIVLQNMLCILISLLLGGFLGAVPTALFLVAGLIGLPVYSGGTGGLAVWAGPTGGFLTGYLIGAFLAGIIAGKPKLEEKAFTWKVFLRLIIAAFVGMIVLYIPGVIHFTRWAQAAGKVPADKSAFAYTMAACVIPYIPGDIIKIVIALPIALKLRPVLAQYLYSEDTKTKSKNDSYK